MSKFIPPNPSVDDLSRVLRDMQRDLDAVRSGRLKVGADLDMRGYGIKGLRKPVDANDAQTKIGDIAGQFAPLASKYVVASNLDPLLPNERLLAGSSSITITDNGGGSTIAISATQAFFDALYQPLDAQLTSLAALSYTGNTLKVIRVNAGETAFELATLSTTAATVTIADAAGDTTTYPVLAGDLTGDLPLLTDPGLSYQATTNALTATTFVGALTGTATNASNGVLTAAGADPSMYVCLFNSGSGTRPFEVSNNIQFDNSTGALKVTQLGELTAGIGSLFLDESGAGTQTAQIVAPVLSADIVLTTPAATGTLALTSDLAAYQPLDTQLTDLAGLAYAGNSLKVLRVNAGETAWELATASAGYTDEEAQDAVGAMVDSTLVYTDGTPALGVDPTLAITSLTLSSLTSGRVPYATTAGLLTDDAGFLYDGTDLTLDSELILSTNAKRVKFKGTTANDYSIQVNASNQMEFRVNTGGVSNATYRMQSEAFTPTALTKTLGTSALGWAIAYFTESAGAGTDILALQAPAITGAQTITLPAATGTLARTDGDAIGATTAATGRFTTLNRRAGNSTTYGGSSVTLSVNTTAVYNVTGGTDTLQSYTLPANALESVGDWVRITALFVTAANGNDKTFSLDFGATSVWLSNTAAFDNNHFQVTVWVIKTGSNTQIATSAVHTDSTLLSAASITTHTTPAATDTGAITIKGTGLSGSSASNDCGQELMIVEWGRA